MRWQYCAQPPSQDLWFGFTEGRLIQRKLLTLWNCAKFFVDYARLADFKPALSDLEPQSAVGTNLLDRWLRERTKRLVQDVTAVYEEYSAPR